VDREVASASGVARRVAVARRAPVATAGWPPVVPRSPRCSPHLCPGSTPGSRVSGPATLARVGRGNGRVAVRPGQRVTRPTKGRVTTCRGCQQGPNRAPPSYSPAGRARDGRPRGRAARGRGPRYTGPGTRQGAGTHVPGGHSGERPRSAFAGRRHQSGEPVAPHGVVELRLGSRPEPDVAQRQVRPRAVRDEIEGDRGGVAQRLVLPVPRI